MDAPNNRPKFLRHYGSPVELRVEQIGPNLWGGSVYRGILTIEVLGATTSTHLWDSRFTALTRENAKDATMAMVQNVHPSEPVQEWRDLSDLSEESWKKALEDREFPGYPPREGMERWPGL